MPSKLLLTELRLSMLDCVCCVCLGMFLSGVTVVPYSAKSGSLTEPDWGQRASGDLPLYPPQGWDYGCVHWCWGCELRTLCKPIFPRF